jgi:hypothetical protein
MKNRHRIKLLVKKLFKKREVLRDPQLMHPEREWAIGLGIALLLFILAAAISVYTYFKNQSINVEVNGDTATEVVYRESLVDEVLATISNREQTLQSLKTDKPLVIKEPDFVATSTEEIKETETETDTETPRLITQ